MKPLFLSEELSRHRLDEMHLAFLKRYRALVFCGVNCAGKDAEIAALMAALVALKCAHAHISRHEVSLLSNMPAYVGHSFKMDIL